jgi:hypothetical protein
MTSLDAWLARQAEQYTTKLRAKKPRAPKAVAVKRATPERDAQKAVVAWLRKAGCIVAASVNESPADASDPDKRARFYAARQRAGVLKGWPDLTVITPGGRVFFCEMKSAAGKPTVAQAELHDAMRARGQVVIVARDIWSAQQAIEAAGIVLSWRTARAEAL